MKRLLKSVAVLGVLALGPVVAFAAEKAATTGGASAPAGTANLFEDPVVARGKGFEIKRSQVDEAFVAYKANLAARNQTVPEDQRRLREAQLLERLITTQLLANRATDADREKARELSKKFSDDARKAAPSEVMFKLQLRALGMTPEQFDKRILEQALAEVVIDRELKSKITVSITQVEEFYKSGADLMVKIMQDEYDRLAKKPETTVGQLSEVRKQIDELKQANLARLEQPERVHVSHLLMMTRQKDSEEPLAEDQKKIKRLKIDQLLARARMGEDFSKLVMEYSEDRALKETKGEYTFSRNDAFVPEFKAAAFSLATNQISDVVTTQFGYHIIKSLEKLPARKADFAKVSAEIKEALVQQELQNQMPAFLEGVKQTAGVEILDPVYVLGPPKAAVVDSRAGAGSAAALPQTK